MTKKQFYFHDVLFNRRSDHGGHLSAYLYVYLLLLEILCDLTKRDLCERISGHHPDKYKSVNHSIIMKLVLFKTFGQSKIDNICGIL